MSSPHSELIDFAGFEAERTPMRTAPCLVPYFAKGKSHPAEFTIGGPESA